MISFAARYVSYTLDNFSFKDYEQLYIIIYNY